MGDGAARSRTARSSTEAFDEFIRDFGSRGPNEWEVRSPTWETRPALALAAIDRMRVAPDRRRSCTAQRRAGAAEREAAAAELLALVEGDPATHGQLAAAIGCSKAWLPGRERTKTNNIRCIHEMRMPMREFGRRMVERGEFDEIEDFGFIREPRWTRSSPATSHPLEQIRGRRAEYQRLQELVPPFVFVGRTDGPDTWQRRDAPSPNRCWRVATRWPACRAVPASAEGIARVMLDSNDPTALQPGDVLIAPITDPSWTPLFVPAAAVVVDVGAATEPRDHRQSRAGHPVRHLGDRRDPADPRRRSGSRRRQHWDGHGAGPERSTSHRDGALVDLDEGAGTVTVL